MRSATYALPVLRARFARLVGQQHVVVNPFADVTVRGGLASIAFDAAQAVDGREWKQVRALAAGSYAAWPDAVRIYLSIL
ncbi:hypothetical protein [Paraburkholderia dinghuensis]|uniref:Uncharacterized protein n=1 Tax=Paraburkholderia dinghuensis TaxID=2305225 RepID=A0A3N6MDM9_9BURK|nr:hypothetical protein [Paraburkholderia dinghuensis]RQH02064.1 hypothetical protein D1Y85_22470 [Paraburkholderia dinghuensis]